MELEKKEKLLLLIKNWKEQKKGENAANGNDAEGTLYNLLKELAEQIDLDELERYFEKDDQTKAYFVKIKDNLIVEKEMNYAAKLINGKSVEEMMYLLNEVFEKYVVFQSDYYEKEILNELQVSEEDLNKMLFSIQIVCERYITTFTEKNYLLNVLAELLYIDKTRLDLIVQKAESYRTLLTSKYLFERLESIKDTL